MSRFHESRMLNVVASRFVGSAGGGDGCGAKEVLQVSETWIGHAQSMYDVMLNDG